MSRHQKLVRWGSCLFVLSLWTVQAAALSVSAAPIGGKPVDPPAARSSATRLESAKAQLQHADGLRKALRATKPEAKSEAQKGVIEAYRAVREFFGSDAPACAEASFRAGELLRTAGDFDAARIELKIARDRGTGSPWKVRANLEIGNLERHVGHREDALASYEAVIADEEAQPRQRDEASLAAGRTQADLGHPDDAARMWKRVADAGEDPLQRIRAFDLLALQLVQKGDLEGGAGMIDRCREALHDSAQEESHQGERVRDALTAMHAIDALARASQERTRKKSEGVRDD